jgi:hypothetical protein
MGITCSKSWFGWDFGGGALLQPAMLKAIADTGKRAKGFQSHERKWVMPGAL